MRRSRSRLPHYRIIDSVELASLLGDPFAVCKRLLHGVANR
jgi:hypothetical protein